MGLALQRHLGSPTSMEPGQFVRTSTATIVCCPLCDSIEEIGKGYGIDPSGKVTPAWICPRCPCIEWLTLASWGEEVV